MSEEIKNLRMVDVPGVTTSKTARLTAVAGAVAPTSNVTFPADAQRPCYRCYDTVFTYDGKHFKPGLYFHASRDDQRFKQDCDMWLCGPLQVIASASAEGYGYSKLLQFVDAYEQQREFLLPMQMLKGQAEELKGAFLDMGLELDLKRFSLLRDYINTTKSIRQVALAQKTGWADERSFLLPNVAIGDDKYLLAANPYGVSDYGCAGRMQDWLQEVAKFAEGNIWLVVAIGSALAGPLISKLELSNGGFHVYGDSSIGKSTISRVACSVWGSPARFMKTWRATANGLEGVAASRNDTLLVLDEIGEADPNEIGKIIYQLGNGQGKSRADKFGGARPVQTWRLMLLSNGEHPIEAILQQARQQLKAGQEVRLTSISAERRFGCFDTLHQFSSGGVLADYLNQACEANYGHLGIAFVRMLVEEPPADLKKDFQLILQNFTAPSGQLGRIAKRFALIAFSAELAIKWQLLPWPQGHALLLCQQLFDEWLKTQPLGSHEDEAIVNDFVDYIARYKDSRFSELYDKEQRVLARTGYFEYKNDRLAYYISSAGMKDIFPGKDIKRVVKALQAAGCYVVRGKNESPVNKRIHGENKKVHVLQLPLGVDEQMHCSF
jgi:putative DNA primase/helicase